MSITGACLVPWKRVSTVLVLLLRYDRDAGSASQPERQVIQWKTYNRSLDEYFALLTTFGVRKERDRRGGAEVPKPGHQHVL